jgi:hypothetical protein
MEDSGSGISSEGPSQSRTEVNSNSFHGVESTKLQLVPHIQAMALDTHVSNPQSPASDSQTSTRVVVPFPMNMSVSHLDTLHSSGSDSFWSARDKGKSPLLDPSIPVHRPDSLGLNVSDFQSVSFYHAAPLYMNSTITNIQEIVDCPSYIPLAQFTDYLSSWNSSPGPFTSGPAS